MAKLLIELEDTPDGGIRVSFSGAELRSAETMSTNTATQNAAILLIDVLRDVGIGHGQLPDLVNMKMASVPNG